MNSSEENNVIKNPFAPKADAEIHHAETEALEPEQANASDTVVAELQQALQEVQAKWEESQDKNLRLQADMENQRRRYEKQVEDAHKYSVQRFAEGLLPVMDSLEMGMQVDGDLNAIREGMDLTLKQFQSVMERFNLAVVNPAKGEAFNPEFHQAMSLQPNPDVDNNTIIMVMQKGYTLSGRVIRPAMVMVCKK